MVIDWTYAEFVVGAFAILGILIGGIRWWVMKYPDKAKDRLD